MTIKANFGQVTQFARDLDRNATRFERGAKQLARKAGADTEAAAKRRAAVDTGRMRSGIGMDEVSEYSVIVGPDVEYAPYVEFGTSRMSPQPFMNPAADQVEPRFYDAAEKLAEM